MIQFLADRRPLGLDTKLPYSVKTDDGNAVMQEVGWGDDHTFIVSVPAWVFREAQRLLDGA